MKASLYTAYHKPSSLFASASIVPIHVGRARASAPLSGMIGDDTGDHISELNGGYCELTALYWAWKNDSDSTHLGLMHYRRLLDFDKSHTSKDAEVFYSGEMRVDDYLSRTEKWLSENPDIDIVLPVVHKMPMTVRTNYTEQHDPADLDFAQAQIAEKYPEYLEDFHAVIDGHELILANMFLAKREIFEQYCAFVFDILEERRLSGLTPKYISPYNARYLGFLAERLFTVYMRKYLRDHPKAKVQRVNIVNLSGALLFPYLSGGDHNGPKHVNVAFSSDRNYMPHAAAMMRSLVDHVNPERHYNLFYLHEKIDASDLELLDSLLLEHPNVTLHPINVGNRFGDHYRATHHAPTNATFNRFLLFDLLPGLDRLLYIDVDMVVLGDIAEVFDTEMGEAKLAAVPDFIMTRVLTTKVVTEDAKVPDLYKYLSNELGLSDDQIASYFNAGLMVLNFAKMDVAKVGRDLMEMVEKTAYFFRDQDILNEYFKDDYLRLPARYNVFNSRSWEYANIPVDNHREAMSARHAPFIVHFAAAHNKPWRVGDVPFAHLYWTYLERTPFWIEMIDKAMMWRGFQVKRPNERLTPTRAVVRVGTGVANRVPLLRPYLLRFYRVLRSIRRGRG